jgi:hypothetical protein
MLELGCPPFFPAFFPHIFSIKQIKEKPEAPGASDDGTGKSMKRVRSFELFIIHHSSLWTGVDRSAIQLATAGQNSRCAFELTAKPTWPA